MPSTLRPVGAALLALGLAGAWPAAAQEADEDLRREIEALKQGQQNIQKQLDELKRLLQQQQQQRTPPPRQGPQVENVAFNLGDNEIKGAKDAGLTLIEFTDYQ
jgi:protein-disulfide isomerase